MREITDGAEGDTRLVRRVIALQPENDDTAWMSFVVPAGISSFAAGQRYLAGIGRFLVGNPQVTDTRMTRIGGRAAEVFHGTGTREGRAIAFTAAPIDLPGARMAVGVAIHGRNAGSEYVPDMNRVSSSFRPN